MMPITPLPGNPSERGYLQGMQLTGAERIVFISGQVPVRPDGSVPEDFESQADQASLNLTEVLGQAGMTIENLVYVRTYLTNRTHADMYSKVWHQHLKSHRVALTITLNGIYDEAWLLEVEAIAAT